MKKRTLLTLCAITLSVQAAQTCNPNIKADTPDSRFTVNADNTVTDKVTGLIWMRCSLGQSGADCSTGMAYFSNWERALAQNGYTFAGQSDWRLPNINELASIIERKCYDPAINLSVFPATTSSDYWSSSPSANNHKYVWVVNFYGGFDHDKYKDFNYHVRLVRGGQ